MTSVAPARADAPRVMSYSSRFWLYAPIALFLLIAAGAMVHWWVIDAAFRKTLDRLKDHEAAPGIMVRWSKVTVGGFPFRIDADFEGFSVIGIGAHGPFAWHSEKFALHSLTYGRHQDVFEAAGRQQVSWTDAQGAKHSAEFLPGALRASAIGGAGGLSRVDLDIIDAGSKTFTAGRLQFHMRRDPDGKDLDLMARGDAVTGFGVPGFQVYETLSNAAALSSLLRGESRWPEAVAAWKKQGGTAKATRVVPDGFDAGTVLSPLY